MEHTAVFSWRQSQESVYFWGTQRKAKQKSKATTKQTAGAIGRLLVGNCEVTKGKQLSTGHFTYVTTSRKATFCPSRGPLNGRYSTTFSVLAGSVFFVCLYPSLGVYPQAVSADGVAKRDFSATEDYLRGSRTPRVVAAKVRRTRMFDSFTRMPLEEKSTLNTPRHEEQVQVESDESRNLVLSRVSTHELTKTQRSSVLAQNSTAAPYYEGKDHSVASSLQFSAPAEDRQILSALTPGGSNTVLPYDHPARTRKARGERILHSFLENIPQTKQKMQKHLHAGTVRTRQAPSASAPVLSSSSAEARQAFEAEVLQKYNGASQRSAKYGRSEGALHATEMPLHQIQHDEESNNSLDAGIAYTQLLPLSRTVSLAADASVTQTDRPNTEKLFPAAGTAAVDGSVDLRANVAGKAYHDAGFSGAEATAPTASRPALTVSPVSLAPTAQLLKATPARQQQILPVLEADQTAYGAATPLQTSVAQLPGVSAFPVPQQQLITTAPEPVQGAAMSPPQTARPEIPSPLQQQTVPSSTAFSPAGVQTTSAANTGGAPGIFSVVGAVESAPQNQQPPTVVAAIAPTALPTLAGAPLPAVTSTTGLSPGKAPTPVINTVVPSTTAALTASQFPSQTPPVPSVTAPAFAVPAPTAATLHQPPVVMSPLSAPASASAEITRAAALGTAAQAAPARAPAQAAAGQVALGVPQTGGANLVPPVGGEGKARNRPSGAFWGALLPPLALSGGNEPTKPDRVVNQAARASGETVKLQTFSQPTCLEACNCVALILGGFVCLFFCLMSVIIATLLMSRLFSKGLFSMAFFRGGANAIFAAAVLDYLPYACVWSGLTIGGLTGGLIRRCWPGSLYFGGGLMSFFAALVLLGKRGAGVGALGGVITGGCIGGLASTEALPITLGCIVGLLLGIVLGFAPIFRDLKMNTRYIRYGFESRQPSLQSGDSVGRMSRAEGLPTKRLSQRLLSTPSKTGSLRTSVSLPSAQGGISRRAESLPSSS